MKNINTRFVDNSNCNLKNPFSEIRPYDGNIVRYVNDLTSELMHYAPDIKQTVTMTFCSDDISIEVIFG